MSVAKSYMKYDFIGETYERDDKEYVKIKYPCCHKTTCTKCGGQGYYPKEVRWYPDPIQIDHRYAFGFREAGYITLLLGPFETLDYHFREVAPRQARYNTIFQWFIPSYLSVPELPKGVTTRRLEWTEISTNDKIHDYDDIRALVSSFYGVLPSEYIGSVGDRIENDFLVIKDTIDKGYYSDSHTYILEDKNNSRYAWKTSARKLEVGEIYHLKGTIKEHLKLEGIKHTVLTRCREG